MKSSRKKMFWYCVLVLLAVYGASLLALFLTQRSMMYHPHVGTESEFLAQAQQNKVLPWRDRAGKLIGWKRVAGKPAPNRLLILHGNGGSAVSRTYLMDGFGASGEWEFYVLEYPGYGWREGAPSETAILHAAQTALDELMNDELANDELMNEERSIFLAGESLGTGVACLLAAKNPEAVKGLFLVTPYTSTADIAAGRFPFFPVRRLMQDRYEAAVALREYSGPVAVLLAGNDYIVPSRFGQALFDGYNGPKKLWMQPQAGHNSLDFSPSLPLWKEVADFLTRPKLIKHNS